MSSQDNSIQDDINEDLIYQQMYEVISEELFIEDNSGEETPNLDSLSLTKQQIGQIRKGGIEAFKEIMQNRFRENIESDSQQEQDSIGHSSKEMQKEQKGENESSIIIENQITPTQLVVNKQVSDEEIVRKQQETEQTKEQKEEPRQSNEIKIENQHFETQSVTPQSQQSRMAEIANQNLHQQQQEYLDTKIDSSSTEKQISNQHHTHHEQNEQKEQKGEQELHQNLNNPEESAQHHEKSLELPLGENTTFSPYRVEKENSYAQNEQSLHIDSENISPIAKKNQDREEQVTEHHNQNQQQQSLSANTSANKDYAHTANYSSVNNHSNNNTNTTNTNSNNSNEKKQSQKANKIINDIFSLSGIKIGNYKSMTPMGYNSVNLSNSNINNNNRRDYNQSAMTQYQTASVQSIRPSENEDTVTRLYRKHQDVQQKIKKMQEDKISQELSTLKPKTAIAKGSQKILKKSNYQKPSSISSIQYKEQIEKRQQLYEDKEKEQAKQEMQGCTFHPQVLQSNVDESQYRSVNEFYSQQQIWQQNKDKNILSSQIDQIQRELSETTFHPKINKQSQSMIRDVKVEEKLIQYKEKVVEKHRKMAEQNQPLFKPVILPKSQELAKKRREKDYTPCFEISSKFN